MLFQIAWFEIRFWIRSWMLWIFLIVIAALVCAANISDEVMSDFALSGIRRNAPFIIATFYAITGVIALLITAVFVNSSALREFSHNMHPIIFSTPVRRRDFLLGPFWEATVISLIPTLGVSVGIAFAPYISTSDPHLWNPLSWTAHLQGILLFALPNAFLIAAILFAAAVVWRREIASFVAVILLFAGRSI